MECIYINEYAREKEKAKIELLIIFRLKEIWGLVPKNNFAMDNNLEFPDLNDPNILERFKNKREEEIYAIHRTAA